MPEKILFFFLIDGCELVQATMSVDSNQNHFV